MHPCTVYSHMYITTCIQTCTQTTHKTFIHIFPQGIHAHIVHSHMHACTHAYTYKHTWPHSPAALPSPSRVTPWGRRHGRVWPVPGGSRQVRLCQLHSPVLLLPCPLLPYRDGGSLCLPLSPHHHSQLQISRWPVLTSQPGLLLNEILMSKS